MEIKNDLTREPLALHGGRPVMQTTLSPLQRWGEPERRQLEAMLGQQSLFYWNGPQTRLLVQRFQSFYPLNHVMPCSSGTAALHIAVAAARIGPGDEVITPPITDMGSVIGTLYQGGVPVFADLCPHTYNLDPADVERKITPRTRAIMAVHLAGNPCDLEALRTLADRHDLILIEDCAQAWGSEYRGRPIGTVGHIGCWSYNDFKHISCGDGGVVASSDARFGPLLQKFGDKAYDRASGIRMPDSLAPNYRISEPQAAVAAAQLTRMWESTGRRQVLGLLISEGLEEIPGVLPHAADQRNRWTVWFYMFRIDPEKLTCSASEFAAALSAEGLGAGAGYIGVPIYKYPVFQEHAFFAGRWPIKELELTEMDYTQTNCPEAEAILRTCISFGVTEAHTKDWAREAVAAIAKVAAHYAR